MARPLVERNTLGYYAIDPYGETSSVPCIKVMVPVGCSEVYVHGTLIFPTLDREEEAPDPGGLSAEEIIGSQACFEALEDLMSDGVIAKWDGAAGPLLSHPFVRVEGKTIIEGDGWIPVGILTWATLALLRKLDPKRKVQ